MTPYHALFGEFKEHVEQVIPLDRNYLHILVGSGLLAVYLIWKAVRRRPFHGAEIVGLVFGIAVLGEILDLWHDIATKGVPNIPESLKDIGLTVVVPVAASLGRPVLDEAIGLWRRLRG